MKDAKFFLLKKFLETDILPSFLEVRNSKNIVQRKMQFKFFDESDKIKHF